MLFLGGTAEILYEGILNGIFFSKAVILLSLLTKK